MRPAGSAMQVVATAGHVDHGKSTLLQRLTGMQPDRFDEERRRGLTIDLGYVWTTLPAGVQPTAHADATARTDAAPVTVAFVDVPGHDRFIANMLSGVGAVGRALLVVAADDGWAAQSEEHLQILRLLGVEVVLAAVTKADAVDPARIEEVRAQVADRLAVADQHEPPVLAVDSHTGRGLDGVAAALAAGLGAPSADPRGRPLGDPWLWVDRAFTVSGAGTVVTGTLISGRVRVGDRLVVLPDEAVARVRGLQCLGTEVDEAEAGSRVAVNLAGGDLPRVRRGAALVGTADGAPVGLTASVLDAELEAIPGATIGERGAWHLHLGSATTAVRLRPLLGELAGGERGPVRLELERPLPARHGERLVLRDAGRWATAGGGRVLDPRPVARRRGAEGRLAQALVLESISDAADGRDAGVVAVEPDGGVIAEEPDGRVTDGRVTGRVRADGIDAATVAALARALVDAHDGCRDQAEVRAALGAPVGVPDGLAGVGGSLVRAERLAGWLAALEAAAVPDARSLADQPLDARLPGDQPPDGRLPEDQPPDDQGVEPVSRGRLQTALAEAGCPADLVDAVIDRARETGRLHAVGGRFLRPVDRAAYQQRREARIGALRRVLQAAGLDALTVEQARRDTGLAAHELQELLDAGEVVAVAGLLLDRSTVQAAIDALADGPGRGGRAFTAAEAKQAWGTSRRTALPLLEHLAAARVTAFDGQRHRLREALALGR